MSEQVRTAGEDRAPARGPLAVAVSLRIALDQLSRALAEPSLDGLVASEASLAEVLARVPVPGSLGAADRAALEYEIDRARVALARCLRLGRGLQAVTRATAEAEGAGAPHGYDARPAGRTATGRTVNARM